MAGEYVQLRSPDQRPWFKALSFEPLRDGASLRVLFVYPNVQRNRTPQLGIAVLSACLEKIGAETRLFDTTMITRGREAEPFRRIVADFRPHLIAYSVRSNEWTLVLELLAIGKSLGIRQIMGGPHATHAPEESIPPVDALVVGEGEGAMMDIARAVVAGRPLVGIPNTWVHTDEGVVKTPKRALIEDLDALPLPHWRLFEKSHYDDSYIRAMMDGTPKIVAAIEGSRGCPFTCTYCSNHALMDAYRGGGRWRREKSPGRMVEELEAFRAEFGRLDFVYWVDEIWLTGVKRLKRFRDLYKARIGVPFSIMERPECISEQKLEVISDAGLCFIAIGLESGDEELRAGLLNRRTHLDVLKRALILPKKFGVKVHAFTMVGLPGQGEASLMKTWSFMRQVMPDTAQFSFFFPLKGTKLYEQSIQMGIYDPAATTESYHAGSVIRQEHVINQELLCRYHHVLNKYVTRRGIWPVIAFHASRKSRTAYWLLFSCSPAVSRFLRHQVRRLNNLLHCTPREAVLKIGRNFAELAGSAAATFPRRPTSRKT